MEYDRRQANAPLVADIEAWIARYNQRHPSLPAMGPTRFGKLAINDPGLLGNLRDGRQINMQTLWRIRQFMAAGSYADE
jgi:hypothetical protein